MRDVVERARDWMRDVHRGSAAEIIPGLLDEIGRLQQECMINLMSRAEQADEAQRWRDRHTRLTELGRSVAAVTPCACSAQRARAEKAEAERDELAATVERVRELAATLNDDLDAAALSEALAGEGGTDE